MFVRACAGASGIVLIVANAHAGALNPPAGPVAPTPGPEPRIAINSTNTPGDADSLFKITAPGSYYLTGNVTGVTAKHGIEIVASGVSIDLMGFDLLGVVGSLDGIVTTVAPLTTIGIRNGSIRSWGLGVDVGQVPATGCTIESVRMSGNSTGLWLGAGSTVVGCGATDNTNYGIFADAFSVVSGCAAHSNGGTGIYAGSGSTVTDCVASQNSNFGLSGGAGSTMTRCVSYENDDDGISVSTGSTVSGCSARQNGGNGIMGFDSVHITGCVASGNATDGIWVANDCHVVGNTCDGNGTGDGAGIHTTSGDNRIESNNCTDNDRGIDVDSTGNIIIHNTCSGNATNWEIAAGNGCLVITATVTGAAITGDSGGASLGSTNPNANFTY